MYLLLLNCRSHMDTYIYLYGSTIDQPGIFAGKNTFRAFSVHRMIYTSITKDRWHCHCTIYIVIIIIRIMMMAERRTCIVSIVLEFIWFIAYAILLIRNSIYCMKKRCFFSQFYCRSLFETHKVDEKLIIIFGCWVIFRALKNLKCLPLV